MGCQGSKITEEAFIPSSGSSKRKPLHSIDLVDGRGTRNRKKEGPLQSMVVLGDDRSATTTNSGSSRSKRSLEPSTIEAQGIECKTIESEKDRIEMRQQKAFEEHIRRESFAIMNRAKVEVQRVRSWNMESAY